MMSGGSRLNNQQWDELLFSCYEGVLADKPENLWQTFLELLKQHFSAQYVTFMIRPPSAGDEGVVLNAHQPLVETYYSYKSHFFAQDPFVDLPRGQAFTLHDVLDVVRFKQSEYYQSYLAYTQAEYILGIDIEDEGGCHARLRLTRAADQSNFSNADKTLLQQLARHISQAIALYSRMVKTQRYLSTYQGALDSMAMGCILLDEQMKILATNDTADQFLADKTLLKIKQSMLQVGSASEHQCFRQLIASMQEELAQTGQMVVNTFSIDSSHSVAGIGILCRLLPPAMTPDSGPMLALFIADPDQPRLSNESLLAQLFGFTRSEARLALLLANGESLDEAAETLGVTRNTVKSHLGSAFSKMGVTRQGQLVKIILRSVASLT